MGEAPEGARCRRRDRAGMTSFFIGLVALSLLVVLGVHVTLLGLIARQRPRYRAAVALLVPPLAPYWAWRSGVRVPVYVWGTAVLLYAFGVAITSR